MQNVLVTTQAYNAEQTIGRTIESVISQSHGDFVYIITDNGSTDFTQSVICDYMKRDKRIKLIPLVKNDPTAYRELTPFMLEQYPNVEWLTGVDADDELKWDCLEKVHGFALGNKLDLVAFGYERVDGASGKVVVRRALSEHMIISGEDFTARYIEYRGFTIFGWGKFVSASIVHELLKEVTHVPFYHYLDTAGALDYFTLAKRVGIFGEALYRYWQYPQSLGRQFHPNRIKSDHLAFEVNKKYLEHYGEISELNMDFLYAIQLSVLQETLNLLYGVDMPLADKIGHMISMFEHPTARGVLTRKAGPQFRNLSQRKQFVEHIRRWIIDQPDREKNLSDVNKLIKLLDVVDIG